MTFKLYLVATAAALGLASSPAAWGESLQDAVALAYDSNPGIQSQRAALKADNETEIQVLTNYGLTGQAQIEEANNSLLRGGPRQSASTTTTTIDFTQPLYTGGRVNAAAAAAHANVLAAREQLRQAEIQLVERVVAAYVAVRRDQQDELVYEDQVNMLTDYLKETRAKYAVRDVTLTDVSQAEARLAGAKTQVANAMAQLANSRSAYLDVVGQNPGQLDPEPDLPEPPTTLDAAIGVAEQQSPPLRQARFTELASRDRIEEAKAEFRPSVALSALAERAPTFAFTPTPYLDEVIAGVTLTVPLFAGGLHVSEVRQARAQNESDRLAADQAQRTLIDNVAQNWNQVVAARTALATDQDQVKALERSVYGERKEEQAGFRSTFEVLTQIQELIAAEAQLTLERYTAYVGQANLLGVLGVLNVTEINRTVTPYSPEKDFEKAKHSFLTPWTPLLHMVDKLPTDAPHDLAPLIPTSNPDKSQDLPPPPPSAANTPPIKIQTNFIGNPNAPIETATPQDR